jgi:hypothetical protein
MTCRWSLTISLAIYHVIRISKTWVVCFQFYLFVRLI